MTPRPCRAALLGLAAAFPLIASAHGGSDGAAHHGLLAGLLHPFTGLDHLLAMLAVGAWGATALPAADAQATSPGGRVAAAARLPLVFAALLLAGALAAAAGLRLPAVEPVIAASLLVLGLLVALRSPLPAAAASALVGGFALFHGAAHGTELGGAAALAGMVMATALLHAAGLALGFAWRGRAAWMARLAGGGTALFGAGLLFFA
ncbi:HupE/UreJ family protein [Aquincola sp. J276]|uniref:HupE/UreJ family protein n=1 Tax=Aquincola sp. J276 TaxID=2898432 RepID=UPI002150F19B|nr:HupE/UreJ family protein [Aquincola sp. J276]MCR5867019.1 HupE/UreJ family protein [Aquincola sp. J276]